VAAGLHGIEVFYPIHTAEQRSFYLELARRHGLLVTGGSDSHHPHQALAQVDPLDLRITAGAPTILERLAS
jgi:3',5'-nucleoside bisphosphate phosphatase